MTPQHAALWLGIIGLPRLRYGAGPLTGRVGAFVGPGRKALPPEPGPAVPELPELRGIAVGPGIGRSEAIARVITWISWTWLPLFTGAKLLSVIQSTSLSDILPGIPHLQKFLRRPPAGWRMPPGSEVDVMLSLYHIL